MAIGMHERRAPAPVTARRQDLVIRLAGEAGEGLKKPGELLAQAAARAGFHLVTDFSPPSEIKGGVCFFQIRLSRQPLHTRGDWPDVLLCFNREAYEVNIRELRPGGLLIFDADAVVPTEGDFQKLAFPMERLARDQLKFPLAKNVIAVGGLATLFDLDTSHLRRIIDELWARKGEAVVQTNYQALELGIQYVEENIPDRASYQLETGQAAQDTIVASGNQAASLGAIAAGCTFFAGYPITPASDIMEYLAAYLPQIGGTVLQAEDEIAAINMVLGASYAGAKAMTATSGPGLSLMVEGLGLGTMAELPCVVVDAQRAGPSTGMPTRHEQGDLYLVAHGGHGEVPRLVLAATSVEDCFHLAVHAFNLAERYQTPVILMTDTVVAIRTATTRRPDLDGLQIEHRLTYQPNGRHPQAGTPPQPPEEDLSSYVRYELTGTGVSPIAIPGTPGGQYVAMGLEHNEKGRHRPDPRTHTAMTEKRFRKLDLAMHDAPPPVAYGDRHAAIGIVTWGSTAGVAIEAIDRAQQAGAEACLVAPRMLHPLPEHQLAEFIRNKRTIIVPEVNFSGQFADMLVARYPRDLLRVNVYGGRPMLVTELAKVIVEAAESDRPLAGRRVLEAVPYEGDAIEPGE